MSTELINAPYWGLFEKDQMDLSTVEYEYSEYREINVTSAKSLSKYEIETRDKDQFLLLHDGYMECRYLVASDATGTAITTQEDTCLQNNALSLFKNAELMCEDQRVEYCDTPAIGHTIKNLAEFSKPYGESIASNQHFFLDSCDDAISANRSSHVRFYNNTGVRIGVEISFIQAADFALVPNVAASDATWQNGDSIVARIGHFNGPVVNFVYKLAAATPFTTALVGTATLTASATPTNGCLTIAQANGAGLLPQNGVVSLRANGNYQAITMYQYAAAGNAADVAVLALTVGGAGTGPGIPIVTANLVAAPFYARSYNIIENSFNSGFHKRVQICGSGKKVSVFIPLKNMFLFCNAFDKVTRGLRWRIVLNKEADNQILLRDPLFSGGNRFVSLDYISCWIPRLKPNLETLKMLESKLISNEAFDVNFTDLTVFRSSTVHIGNANNTAVQLSTTTKKPIRVWVAFQKQARVEDATQTVNKRVFDLIGTTAVQCRLNGKIFPLYEYKITYPNNDGIPDSGINRCYNAFLNAGYKMHGHHDSSLIDINSFVKYYPIFYFDLTAQDEDLFKSQKSAEIEIRWSNTAGALGQNYYMWCVYESERLIKMSGVNGSLSLVL